MKRIELVAVIAGLITLLLVVGGVWWWALAGMRREVGFALRKEVAA